ncbi:salivary glue protein Sgs-3-like isoform X2 [Macrobrachium rosenbergii]|uniref:salivary glue protein Sgs-3-like isoform X2 n=1 Tax=Macrobrachium rosenbergii TaxID=79674 RepID=UPI0034D648CA
MENGISEKSTAKTTPHALAVPQTRNPAHKRKNAPKRAENAKTRPTPAVDPQVRAAKERTASAALEKCVLKGVRKCVSSANDCQGSIAQGFECKNDKICCILGGVGQATTNTCEKKASRTCVSSKRECSGVIKKKFTCDGTKLCCAQGPTSVAPPRKLASAMKPKPQDSDDQGGNKGRKPTAFPKAGSTPSSICPPPNPACTNKKGICQKKTTSCPGPVYRGKKYCPNAPTCVCCGPEKPCPQTSKCTKNLGKCQNKSVSCPGKTRKGCKGKNCICCVPNPTTATPTTTKAPTTTTVLRTTTTPPPTAITKAPTTTAGPTPVGR